MEAQNSPSQVELVDFKTADLKIDLDENSFQIKGEVNFDFEILQQTDSVFLDAKNLIQYQIELDGTPVSNPYNGKQIVLRQSFKPESTHTVKITFTSEPTKAFYFIDADRNGKWEQAWTQGQGKYTSNWLPSLDDANDKLVWNIAVRAPDQLTALANGVLEKQKDGYRYYTMENPMSSYLVAIVCGRYEVMESETKSGVDFQQFFYPSDKAQAELIYQNSINLFVALEEEIGVNYPWEVYKQAPVKDFLYSGMENTTLTLFNDQFVVDSLGINDRNYTTVNAHEMAHHWFGNLVTAQSGKHHWLQEGFATYYALLAEKKLYGNEHFQVNLYEHVEALVRQEQNGGSAAVLDENASSLTFYQHGAWALHALQDLIGEIRFRESVKKYLLQYQFKTATTDDFLTIVEQVSEKDLSAFKQMWLESKEFPTMTAIEILRKDQFMQRYFELISMRERTFDNAYSFYKSVLKDPVSVDLVTEMVAQLQTRLDDRRFVLHKDAAALNIPEVNQMIALTATEVNEVNKDMMYDFLNAPSYLTRESTLYILWQNSIDKKKLLQDSREMWAGQVSPSLDLAWIAMALNTEGFKKEDQQVFLKRMQSYTSPKFSTVTRTAAFDYLLNLRAFSLENVQHLMMASLHHSWRFYKNSREVLRALNKDDSNTALINAALGSFEPADQEKLRRILDDEI